MHVYILKKMETTALSSLSKLLLNIFLLVMQITVAFAAHIPDTMAYRRKYNVTLKHYSQHAEDSLKLRAAYFLIDNMDGHKSPVSSDIQHLTDTLQTLKPLTNVGTLNDVWRQCNRLHPIEYVQDSCIVTDDWLIQNIEQAFDSWTTAPWFSDIDFEQFCEYILPYRVGGECLSSEWRCKLRQMYAPHIKDETDILRAFVTLRDSIDRSVKFWQPNFTFSIDVLTTEHIRRANCDQSCLLLVSILRSLGIPAAFDYTPIWADYSDKGHSWVSVVLNDGDTYTIFGHDHKAIQNNRFEASVFECEVPLSKTDYCPYQIKQSKQVSKVYRMGYRANSDFSIDDFRNLSNVHAHDVSAYYPLNGKLQIKTATADPIYLCTFVSGRNWEPIAKSIPIHDMAQFDNIGTDIVYLPMRRENGLLTAVSSPVLVSADGHTHSFDPDFHNPRTIVIDRKYPLCSYMPGQWKKLIGGRFEGASCIDFSDAVILATIDSMPWGVTQVDVEQSESFRYVRYLSSKEYIAPLTELSFYTTENGKEKKLNGTIIYEGVVESSLKQLFDGNLETKVKAKHKGYWVGIDLKESEASRISKISYSPVSDTNNVEVGHLYELYYFEQDWVLIAQQKAVSDKLTFFDVPSNTLLLLRDRSKGKEERIFEYKDGNQLFY